MAKNLLVIGNGGREHAICWKLSQSNKVGRIFALPGSPGISQEAKTTCVADVQVDDFKVLLMFWPQCIYVSVGSIKIVVNMIRAQITTCMVPTTIFK